MEIEKGETEKVEITLEKEDFEWFDTQNNTMRTLEGEYTVYYGGTSDMSKLKKLTVEVK